MRPLIVVGPTPPPYNGVSLMTARLLEAVCGSGRRVLHLDTRDPRPVTTMGTFDWPNVKLAVQHGLRFLGLLLRERDAAVYVPVSQSRWGFVRDAVFLIAARIARRPRYIHLHGGYFGEFWRTADPALRLLIRMSVTGAQQGWVLTPTLRPNLEALLPSDRVHVLENAVDAVPSAPGDRDSAVRVLYLSNLLPEKGCFTLLAAVEELGDRARGLRIDLAGDADPDVRDAIERAAERLAGHGVEVHLPGTVVGEAKERLLREADVFAYPTEYTYEGQPLVLLEALAAGLPIVTTEHAGIPDTVRDDREGLLVPPGDASALASALLRLIEDPDLRARLGSAARERYDERYRLERFASEVRKLLALA